MKIFISWSGKPSENIALALKEWLPFLFTGIEPFVSSENVRKGKRWQIEIAKELESSNFGIVCLTPDNTEAPWIIFEAGALSKSLKESSVSTLLTGGLRNSDIEGPLSHFQHTSFEKEDFFKLITAINDAQENGKQDATRLLKIFDKFWDELNASVEKALKTTEKPEKKRPIEDMVRELLDVTNSIAKNMPQEEGILARVKSLYGASLFPEHLVRQQWKKSPEPTENIPFTHESFIKHLRQFNPIIASDVAKVSFIVDIENHRLILISNEEGTETYQLLHDNYMSLLGALRDSTDNSWGIAFQKELKAPGQ